MTIKRGIPLSIQSELDTGFRTFGPGQTLVGAAEENCASFSGISNGYSVLEIKTRCFFLKLVVGGGLKCDLIRHSQHHGCSMRTDVSMFPTHFADVETVFFVFCAVFHFLKCRIFCLRVPMCSMYGIFTDICPKNHPVM